MDRYRCIHICLLAAWAREPGGLPAHSVPEGRTLRRNQPNKNKGCARCSEVQGGWLSWEASTTVAMLCHGKKRNLESCKAAQHPPDLVIGGAESKV